jgi:hypothetical protein
MMQTYAADAGIEDGFYQVKHGNMSELPLSFSIPDVNGCEVDVDIEEGLGGFYKITSTATGYDGDEVSVEAYAEALDYSYLLWNAISSYGDISLASGVEIHGNITLNGELDVNPKKVDEIIDGNTTYGGLVAWPSAQAASEYYLAQVPVGSPYLLPNIDIEHDDSMGPLYVPGGLDIYSSNSTATFTIDDTFYVVDAMEIGSHGQTFTLDLNGQTIFCEKESESVNDFAIDIGGAVTITGSGCIIAVGDIRFMPNILAGEGDFIFVMSIVGDLTAQPLGDFYGSMAGMVEIDYQPGVTLTWSIPPNDLNFPKGDVFAGIRCYIIRG